MASDPASVSTREEIVSISSCPKTRTKHATLFLTKLHVLTLLIPLLTRLHWDWVTQPKARQLRGFRDPVLWLIFCVCKLKFTFLLWMHQLQKSLACFDSIFTSWFSTFWNYMVLSWNYVFLLTHYLYFLCINNKLKVVLYISLLEQQMCSIHYMYWNESIILSDTVQYNILLHPFLLKSITC